MNRRVSGFLAALVCLCWLGLATGFAAPATAASERVDLGGEPLPGGSQGSSDGTKPIELDPGLWQATLTSGFEQYFTYQRRIKDSRVHIGVLGAPAGGESDGIGLKTSVGDPADSTTCGDDDASSDYNVPQGVLGAAVVVGDEDDATCRSADAVTIMVDRGSSSATADLPYVIKVVEEAPSTGEVGEPDAQPSYVVPEPGTAREMAGAASFDDAPLIDASGGATTVKATVTEGTELLWRVPAGWGEQPVARVDIPAAEGADAEALGTFGGPQVNLNLVTPTRGQDAYSDSSVADDSGTYQAKPEDEPGGDTLAITGYPVTQANGLAPGDHWIAVSVAPPVDRDALDVPIELTVELQGEAGDGPSYNDAVLSQDNEAGPKGYSSAKPFLVADGTFSAVASGNPHVAEDDGDGWFNGRRWTGLALGLVSALCLGAGAVRLRARR